MTFSRVLVIFAALVACIIAQDCKTPGGQIDTFQTSMCNCWSGYAPSTTDGIDCKSHPKCAPAMPDDSNTLHSNAPKRPSTIFAYDSLEIVQQIPIVANRKATWIQFVVPTGLAGAGTYGAKTCQYPGPLWNKTINGRDCIDEYRASLPWSQNGMCGFAKDPVKSVNGTNVYSSILFTTVTDTYTVGKSVTERVSTTSYLISVSFLTKKTFTSGTFTAAIIDPNADGVLTKFVVSDSVYDPATGATIVELVTTAQWPYKLSQDSTALLAAFVNVVPAISNLDVTFNSKSDPSLSCGSDARSACAQRWQVSIKGSTGCVNNIKGEYNFREPLVCRDNITNGAAGACPVGITSLPLSISVHDTQLCTTTPVDTSTAGSYTLTAFSDAERSITSKSFQTGATVYWTFDIENSLVSIQSVSINSIQLSLTSGGTADVLYSADAGGVSATGTSVNLVVTPLSNPIHAGSKGSVTFSYDLLRANLPNTVGLLQANNYEVNVATAVVIDIQYHGNKKKSVAMELGSLEVQSSADASKVIRVVAPDLMTENQNTANNNIEEVTNAAGVVATSLMAVVCFLALFLF